MTLVDTTTGEVVSLLSEHEARDLTNRIKGHAETLWALLLEAHDRQAWKALGYDSWREYGIAEFGMSQSRAYQILDQGRVIREIEGAAGVSTKVEISEREARDIKPHLHAVTEQIRERVQAGDDPTETVTEIVRETRTQRRRPSPSEVSPEEHERRTAIAALVSSVEVLGRRDLDPAELIGVMNEMQRARIGRALEPAVEWLLTLHAGWDATEGAQP